LVQQKEIDAYQSEPSKEKRGSKSSQYGPEMLETWLLLEFCDRHALISPHCLVINMSVSVHHTGRPSYRVSMGDTEVQQMCKD